VEPRVVARKARTKSFYPQITRRDHHCEKPLTLLFGYVLFTYMTTNQYSPGLTLPSFTPLAGTLNSDVPPMTDAQIALADIHLRQLAQLRDIGMRLAADAEADMPQGIKPPAKNALMTAYAQLTKAIRQIMALEEEIIGLREKRVSRLRATWKQEKATAVRRSVEKSLTAAKPQMQRVACERLLGDLFRDYNDYSRGSIRDLVADICKTLGIEADLSLWDEPQPGIDIALPAGYEWIIPANGDKPYTIRQSEVGRVWVPFDSPHITGHGDDPPGG
jgi:hypothetical protein